MATHLTVNASGGADHTTIGAALSATSSGTAGEYSTITILDSSTYSEALDFAGLQYVRLTADTGCAPKVSHMNNPITIGTGADHIEIVGASNTSRMILETVASVSLQRCLYVTELTANWRAQYVTFRNAGISGYGVQCAAGNATGTWTIHDCGVSGNAFKGFLISAAATLDVQRCDWTGATLASWWGQIDTLNASTFNRCRFKTPILVRAYGAYGVIAGGKWTITNNIFEPEGTSEPFLQLWDGGVAGGNPPNADVWNNTFCRIGAAGTSSAIGVTGTVANVAIANNGIVGFGTGVTTANPITITNNGFYGNTADVGAGVTNTAPQTADPLMEDPGAGNYLHQVGSPWADTGATLASVTEDYDGQPRPMYGGTGLLYDIGAFEIGADAPDLISATHSGRTQIAAIFDQEVFGADLEDASKWTVTAPFGGSALTVDSVSCSDGTNATLTVSPMSGNTLYRVTCPDTLVDDSGLVIVTTVADFVSPIWPEPESGNPWAVTADGETFDIGAGLYELVPWAADYPLVSLRESVEISLFSDRRASDDDPLPDSAGDPVDRRGWPGDAFDTSGAGPLGSRLWLLVNQPITSGTTAKVREYCREALAWMVDVGVAARVDARAWREGADRIGVEIVISQADGNRRAFRFDDLWSAWRA